MSVRLAVEPTSGTLLQVAPHDGDARVWDDFIAAAEGSTFCHRAAWRDVLRDTLGAESYDLVARDAGGAIRGVLPLARVRSLLFGDYLVSLPFLNAGGPVGDATARDRLIQHAAALARRLGVDLLELRSREAPASGMRVVPRKLTVLLALPSSAAELWERFPAKLRSQIRRPRKEGLEARFGLEERHAFYDVFARHMRDLGTPVLPREFFERVAQRLGDLVLFGAVYRGAEPVAAGCGFLWRGEVEITWAAALRAHQRVAPNMQLYWAFLEQAIARGARMFDFGRCTPGGGTHHFKRQWGGVDVPLPWAQWSPHSIRATPSPERPVYRVAVALWKRLPMFVTNRLGPRLAKRLP